MNLRTYLTFVGVALFATGLIFGVWSVDKAGKQYGYSFNEPCGSAFSPASASPDCGDKTDTRRWVALGFMGVGVLVFFGAVFSGKTTAAPERQPEAWPPSGIS